MLNLLLVEDDDVDVLALNRALSHAKISHRIVHAHDGDEALGLLRNGGVRREGLLIFLDLEMPGMHGLVFLEHLRNDPTLVGTPVLVLTGSDDEDHRRIAHRRNVAGYFRKPLDFDGLVKLLRDIESYWSKGHFAP